MVVDAHAHTSAHPMKGLHTICADLPELNRLADKFQIQRIVLMATYFPLKGTGLHNQQLLTRIEGNKRFLAFLSLDMTRDLDSGLAEIERLAGHHQVVGIKLYPGYQDFDPSGTDAYRLYRLATHHQLPVALHAGELHHCCSQSRRQHLPLRCGYTSCKLDELAGLSHPNAFEKAISDFPEINFLVCHLANPHFSELRNLMKIYPNIYTDLSGQFLSGTSEDTSEYRELLTREIGQFLEVPNGVKRLLFGSDFPIQTHYDSLDLVERLKLSADEADRVLGKNAAQLLNLKGAK